MKRIAGLKEHYTAVSHSTTRVAATLRGCYDTQDMSHRMYVSRTAGYVSRILNLASPLLDNFGVDATERVTAVAGTQPFWCTTEKCGKGKCLAELPTR